MGIPASTIQACPRLVRSSALATLLLFISLILLVSSGAAAQTDPPDAANGRLQGLSAQERALLSPYLAHGPVAMSTFTRIDGLPEIVIASRVHAPAQEVVRILNEPEHYPRYMPALDSVEVQSRHQSQTAYRWSWRASILVLEGNNVHTYQPVTEAHARDHGYQIDIRAMDGAMGTGRMVFRVFPEGANQSLLVLSSRLDFRDGNYVFRQMSSGGRSVTRSINIAVAHMMVMGTQEEAERRSGYTMPPPSPAMALARPRIDMAAIAPLLARGDVVMLDRRSGQVNVVGRTGLQEQQIRRVMNDPELFGRSLVQGAETEIVSREDNGVVFDWNVPTPFVGGSGRMRLQSQDSTFAVDGVRGNLSQAQFRFDTHRFDWGESAIVGWSKFDPADMSWLIRRVVSGIPHFGDGLRLAGQIMVLRSVRGSARRG